VEGQTRFIRLFIAIELTNEIRGAVEDLLDELRKGAPQAKWVRAENLHVTLKFLGRTEPNKLEAIQNALGSLRSLEPITLDFHGLGFFPNEKRPGVFWMGMKASPNLPPLAETIDQAMHKLGFPLETRPFAPHLTLARFEPPGLPGKLGPAVKQNSTRNFGSLAAREFHLIESKLKPTGAEYTTLQSFPFVAAT
jgi:RNA 2',3'-cyclic 3'-phosphodiesterase